MLSYLKKSFDSLKKFSERANLGSAYRYPRLIAGQCTSLFFFLGSIAQVPFNTVMSGSTAVMITSVAGLTSFLTQAKENYDAGAPEVVAVTQQVKTENEMNSNYKTLKTLQEKFPEGFEFSRSLGINSDKLYQLDEYNSLELYQLCLEFYSALQTPQRIAKKYLISAFQTFAEFAGNYLEFMLAKAFWGYAPYELNEGITLRNLSFSLVTLVAVYNSYQIYEEAKKTYEIPEQEKLTKDILVAYHKFCLLHPKTANTYGSFDETPLLAPAV